MAIVVNSVQSEIIAFFADLGEDFGRVAVGHTKGGLKRGNVCPQKRVRAFLDAEV